MREIPEATFEPSVFSKLLGKKIFVRYAGYYAIGRVRSVRGACLTLSEFVVIYDRTPFNLQAGREPCDCQVNIRFIDAFGRV